MDNKMQKINSIITIENIMDCLRDINGILDLMKLHRVEQEHNQERQQTFNKIPKNNTITIHDVYDSEDAIYIDQSLMELHGHTAPTS